ncbi:MAG: hypothetical protein Q4G35_12555 [Propionibacteriaceae bacterium]|nr:hypothetical protein [Propionibacteriaceae bacterium]
MTPVEPTGASHDVAPHELFFSTTDAKGIIKQANSVFVRLSRFSREQLVGAPHNIIRHPAMPGGAFLLMWLTLQQGKPFCAYVDNLAADGSQYTVFATVTPLGDDYLSVRARPAVGALLDAARGLYAATRPLELEARANGASAHDAAVAGLERLAHLLGEAGIPSYDAFIQQALPAEVAARAGATERRSADGPLGQLLAETQQLRNSLGAWVAQLDELQKLADDLVQGGADLQRATVAGEESVQEISEALARSEGFSPLSGMLSLWAQMTPEVASHVTPLAGRLEELRSRTADTRFRIALAALHSETVEQFVGELIDGGPGSDEARPAILDLTRALHEGIAEASTALSQHTQLANAVADEAQQIVSLMRIPTTVLATWQAMAAGQDDAITALLPTAAEVVDRGIADAERLLALAERCRAVEVGSPDEILTHLRQVEESTGQLQL